MNHCQVEVEKNKFDIIFKLVEKLTYIFPIAHRCG